MDGWCPEHELYYTFLILWMSLSLKCYELPSRWPGHCLLAILSIQSHSFGLALSPANYFFETLVDSFATTLKDSVPDEKRFDWVFQWTRRIPTHCHTLQFKFKSPHISHSHIFDLHFNYVYHLVFESFVNVTGLSIYHLSILLEILIPETLLAKPPCLRASQLHWLGFTPNHGLSDICWC